MRLSITLLFANGIFLATASPLSGVAPTFGLASWDLEGYAKDNPIGPTTGGEGGEEVYVSTGKDLLEAVKGDEPRVIYVKGTVELPERAKVGSNKSILGVGWDAHIKKNGITVNGTNNVVIRNLKISYIEGGDCIALNNATRVWIDHNEFESELSLEVGPDTYVSTISIVIISLPWRRREG
jgi:pectate lyase